MKKSFTLLEIIFVLILITIVLALSIPKYSISKIKYAKEQIILHLKYVRYLAMIDNKYNTENEWYKQRWTLKFQRCRESIGGIYYMIYSDKDMNGYIKKEETMKDPLTYNYLYATNQCSEDSLFDKANNVLVTKYFGIEKIKISCNTTTSLGQLSFAFDGKVFTKLTNDIYYELDETCLIELIDSKNQSETIKIEPKTGYIY